MPFVRVPVRIPRTDPDYLAMIIDRTVPVFETVHHAHPHVQHTRTLMILLANINRFVLAVKALIPHRARDEWFAFIPPRGSATSPRWDTYPSLYSNWLFPGMEVFPDDQPLCNPLSATDHATLLRIASPTLCALLSFLARGKANNSRDTDHDVHLLNEAIDPQITIFQTVADEFRAGRLSPAISQPFFNTVRALIEFLPSKRRNDTWTHDFLPEDPDFANLFLTASIAIPRAPHEDTLEDPYPIKDMSSFDPIWYWWRRLQEEYRPQGEGTSPHPTSDSGSHAGSYSPRYVPTMPPSPSPTPAPGPTTPPAQTGLSAVGSASFDIRQLLNSARKDSPTPHKASAIAASPSNSAEMQKLWMTLRPAVAHLALLLEASEPLAGVHLSCVLPLLPYLHDTKGRPMIKTRSSQRSVTPPASEAYNEEGEEEKEDEEEEEEPPRPAKCQRTSSNAPKSKCSDKGKGKVERKTQSKSKRNELPPYVPPRPVPTMDTVRLVAESLAKEQSEPTVVVRTASFAIAIASTVSPGTLCDHCNKGRLSHCSHTFTVSDHTRAANHLEPYTRLSNERGNELITDLSTARADYELAREQLFRASARLAVASNRIGAWIREMTTSLGPDGLPGMAELPEELQPIWAQLLLDSETELSNNYRASVLRYPFISDPCRTESTNDKDPLAPNVETLFQLRPENPCDSCLGNPSSCTFIRWNAPCFPCIVQMNQDHCIFLNREAFCLRLAQYRDIRSTLLPDIERDAWVAQFYSDCAAAFHLWDHAPIPISYFFAQGIVEYIRPIPITRALAGFDELEKIFKPPIVLDVQTSLFDLSTTP
ncbi:hypothetical protein B0H14DRAFT_3426202 [Mycena olivaceomarginata]|nr:hypothetical protein B0H14DRAFT_3426202 [Mycena olivaceomarginata]